MTETQLTRAEMFKRIEERNRQNEEDRKLLEVLADKALNDLCDKFIEDLKAEGFHIGDALDVFDPIPIDLGKGRKSRPKRGGRVAKVEKISPAADSKGAKPIPGATYKLPTGEKWTKSPEGKGAANKLFLAAVKAGATWDSLQVK